MHQVIYIHTEAPLKPPVGQACNGCGVCCAAEPCPVGMLLSRRRRGPCKALRWQADEARYRCGLLLVPLTGVVRRAWQWWAARLIAAGSGCDAWIDTVRK